MGAFQVIKKSITAGWNVTAWVGTKNIKQNAVLVKELASSAFNFKANAKNSAPEQETFAQAMRRLSMTEQSLQKRIKTSGQIIMLCGLLSIPMFAYTVYMFLAHFYLSGFVCLMLAFLMLAYVFREHFNRFQMRQRRLGCTFAEWAAATFRSTSTRKK